MLNVTETQGVYLNVPLSDWVLLKELIRKFGWQSGVMRTCLTLNSIIK